MIQLLSQQKNFALSLRSTDSSTNFETRSLQYIVAYPKMMNIGYLLGTSLYPQSESENTVQVLSLEPALRVLVLSTVLMTLLGTVPYLCPTATTET